MKQIYTIILMFFMGVTNVAWAEGSLTINAGNGAMNDAIDQARATLPTFLRNVVKNGESLPQATLKVGFDTNRANIGREYLWVGPFTSDGHGNFSGFLLNEPENINELHEGEMVEFKLHDIVDWSIYLKDKKSYGEFTTRVLLQSMDGAEASATRDELSASPIPKGWK